MSELRIRMIRDMTVRGFSPRTHEAYIRAVVGLAKYYRRPPDQLTHDEGCPGCKHGGNQRAFVGLGSIPSHLPLTLVTRRHLLP